MIQEFADWFAYSLIGVDADSKIGQALDFFIYDSLKIVLLLFGISIVMGIVNAYFPIERLRNYLTTHKMYGFQYLLASIFGAITPFCSCSSIPLFIGFVKGGIPLGVSFSFLITSPLINEVAIAMFAGTFGSQVTLIYVASGIILGVVAGFILGKLNLEKHLSPWVIQIQQIGASEQEDWEMEHTPFLKRFPSIVKGAWEIVKGVLIYVIVGIGIGAAMHGYVPEGFFVKYLGGNGIITVPLAVILAVPMYANAAGIVPVVEVLVAKGVSLGTALAFMMSVVGLSLPEATMLKKVMSMKLILIFFGTITVCNILLGWFFNIFF